MTPPHRQIVPPGRADDAVRQFLPIVEFLESRGLPVLLGSRANDGDPERALGFRPFLGRKKCAVRGLITAELWAEVQQHFDLPPAIVYDTTWPAAAIRDELNLVEVEGTLPPTYPDAILGQVAPDGREIIPGGSFNDAVLHLYPIAEFLRDEAGLRLTWADPDASGRGADSLGFVGQPDGWRCFVGGPITPAIWAALNERFLLPRNLVYWPAANTTTGGGMIRDNDNWVDIIGTTPR